MSLSFRYLFLLRVIFNKLRSWYYTRKITDGTGKIIFKGTPVKLDLTVSKKAKFNLNGNLIICPHNRGREPIRIIIKDNATLMIDGEFTIGNGVCISVSKGGILTIGGKYKESGSGITANSTIMVNKKIAIGKDFVCAWNVFITDSDWHYIEGQNHQKDIFIGDHVWIANNSNILKGTTIKNNTIVASNSKLINKTFESNTIIAGTPAKVVRNNVKWKRDIR